MARRENVLQRINTELEEEWEARLNPECRIYYLNHKAQTTSWLPPRENWAGTSDLPYGWETGVDRHDKEYFINHVEHYTTRDDPRQDPDYVEPPAPREVELSRDTDKGFGFVAGSEKPVVVRFVTEGGPSEEKLMPGDQILKINGQEVRRAPRERVIELVRSCKETIVLTVCQPYTDNSNRKSALLTAAKKAKLKSNPSRVRFADAVLVNGASVAHTDHSPSPVESYVPFMPNVLKVFLENGQTKSFKYDNKTTVKDVVASLQEKLNISSGGHHFSLVLQNMKNSTGTAAAKMTLLMDQETLAEIAARQGARYFRCLFRVTFVPKDPYDLLKEDPIAFEYFYLQCCNDVLQERFASEMKYDTALRLAALQIQQHAMSNSMSGKISVKSVLKECGVEKFVCRGLLETMKGKEVKRQLSQFLKLNQGLAAPGQKQLSALQAKLHYMKMVSHLKTFGSRVFMVTLLDQRTEAMLLVGPHSGISIVTNIKSYALSQLTDFEQLEQVKVTKDGDNMQRVDLRLKQTPPGPFSSPHIPSSEEGERVVSLGLLSEDAHNLVCLVAGYYRLFVDPDRRLVDRPRGKNTSDPDVPSYENVHRVHPSSWAYPADLVSEVVGVGRVGVGVGPMGSGTPEGAGEDSQRVVDLGHDPPPYLQGLQYLDSVKQDLGLQSTTQAKSRTERSPNGTEVVVGNDVTSSDLHNQAKVNGVTSLFEEGVTSFGTSSSEYKASSQSRGLAGASGLSRQPVLHTTIDLRKVSGTNGHAPTPIAQSADSERSSDTDSLSAGGDAERRPLLAPAGVTQNGDVRHSVEGESDDTDSFGTPSGSPAKAAYIQRAASIESGMHSFGLHSPDLLPEGEAAAETLTEVDVSQLPPEVYRAIYTPHAAIPPQRLYFDPDIIDLTIFPLPDSVLGDDDSMIDFTTLPSLPPPSFANSHPYPPPSPSSPQPPSPHLNRTTHISDFSQGYPVVSVSGSGSGLVRSASADNCPDFFDHDIDTLIAQYYVPPPPSSSPSPPSSQSQVLSQSLSGAIHSTSPHGASSADDDFSSLIIPPPPPSSSFQPDAEASTAPSVPKPATEKRRHFRHKRSSSVDIGALNMAKRQLQDAADQRKSLDSQTDHQRGSQQTDGIGRRSPPRDLQGVEKFDSGPGDGLAAESPATVSMKLHNLLKSLPNLAPEVSLNDQEQQPFHRTGSLRIPRSASCDFVPVPQSGAEVAQTFTGKATQRTLFSGTVSLGRSSGQRAVSHQQLTSPEDPARASGQQHQDHQQQQQSASESFASLKAKLKDYRDHLLRRASHSRKNSSSDEPSSENGGEKKKGSLRRSNSFSRLLAQFSGRHGSKSSDPVVVGDGNWTLRQRGSHLASSTGDLTASPGGEGGEEERRGTPAVRETFALSRTSLRPVSTSDAAQSKSKKSGPLKALSMALGSEDRTGQNGGQVTDGHRKAPRSPGSPGDVHNNFSSKDDLSVLTQGKGRKKKDKMKTNPYATTRMWRPIATTSSLFSQGDPGVHTFTNFDVLIGGDSSGLPATGDLRNEDFFHAPATLNRTISNPVTASELQASITGDAVPPDYHPYPSPDTPVRSVNYAGDRSPVVKKRLEPKRSAPPAPVSGSSEQEAKRTGRRSSSGVTIPLKTRSLSAEEAAQLMDAASGRSRPPARHSKDPPPASAPHGGGDLPADFPRDSSPSSVGSQRTRSLSEGSRGRKESAERRGRTVMDSSYDVLGPDVGTSVKNVISKTYGSEGFETAWQDVDVLLSRLKATLDAVDSLQGGVSSSGSQFHTVKQELQLQTKQFVEDAKRLVACANGPRRAMGGQLDRAMTTLARMLLHAQAAMVRMQGPHHAQHVGYELLKVTASFQGTVNAANAALGKPTSDPHMKYLMRQATHLAGLLSTLLKTLKTLEQT